jgi:ornithine carbamoyltransferase
VKIPVVETDHLLSVTDLTRDEILSLFEFTSELKLAHKKSRKHHLLPGKTLAMIFEKSSTRTRVSFEAGIYQLGGTGMFLSSADIQLGRGETIADTARVLSRYVDCIMIRTFEQEKVDELARFSDIPIINGLTDLYHPCQALTDYFTVFEYDRDFSGKKMTYIGDGNNMCNSLLLCGALLGMDVSVACPKRYAPDRAVVEQSLKIARESGSRSCDH